MREATQTKNRPEREREREREALSIVSEGIRR